MFKLINKIIAIFSTRKENKKAAKSSVITNVQETFGLKAGKIRIAFIVPHTLSRPGAKDYNGETERITQERVCIWASEFINNHFSDVAIAKLFYRDKGGISGAYSEAGEWLADIAIEPHQNSFEGAAYGFMWLVPDTCKESIRFALTLADRFWTHYNIKKRHTDGLKRMKSPALTIRPEDGAKNVWEGVNNGIPIVLLLEPCFANRKTIESEKIIGNLRGYAEWLAKNIVEIAKNR